MLNCIHLIFQEKFVLLRWRTLNTLHSSMYTHSCSGCEMTHWRQCKAFIIKTTSSFFYSFTEYLHVKVSLSLKKNNPKWQNHCYRLLKHTFHSRIILHMFVHAHIHIIFFSETNGFTPAA